MMTGRLLKKSPSLNRNSPDDSAGAGILYRAGFCACIWFFLLSVWASPSWTQVSSGGVPLSAGPQGRQAASGEVILRPPDLDAAAEEDLRNPLPYRFAINLPVNVTVCDDGTGIWTTLPAGDRIWLLTIRAPGALALTVYFERFILPQGGKLFIYSPDRSVKLGAFTGNDTPEQEAFAAGPVRGDCVIVEYDHPAGCSALPKVTVSEVAYAYRGIAMPSRETGFGTSGECEVNVTCPEGIPWWDQQKGVARIGVKKYGATYWCSGSLVNNTRQDHTPFLLTADHCGKGATALDISQWIFYFNYLSPACQNPPEEPPYRSLTGASLKAAAGDVNISGSDFFLVCLNQDIPDTFDVWFNGWNRIDDPSPEGVGIHHPSGDIKKISTYTVPLISTNWNGHPEMTHWEVVWSGTVSGHGVTEGGSSGSPLFDPEGRIVGVLTGGNSLCDSISLNQPDYYGKFSYSWNMDGTDSTERLDCWLDPDQTGVTVLDGIPLVTPEHVPASPDLLIYPNPVYGIRNTASTSSSAVLYLRSSLFKGNGDFHFAILDAWGRKVIEETQQGNTSGQISMEVSSLPSGFYLLQVRSEQRLVTGRFLKL